MKKNYIDEFLEEDPRLKRATDILGSDAAHKYLFDCPPIDIPYGIGIHSGKVYEIFGRESHGKSALALEFAKSFCNYWKIKNEPYLVLWLECEEAFDKARAKWLGLDITRVLNSEVETVEEGWDILKNRLTRSIDKKMHLFLVWDTIAAASTKEEKEKGPEILGNEGERKAKKIRAMLRDLVTLLGKTDSTLVFVNQVYSSRNSYGGSSDLSSGGGGIKFHASVRTQITQTNTIKRITPDGEEITEGIISEIFHTKNKLTLPKQRSEIAIMGESGVDRIHTCQLFLVKHKLIESKGAWKVIEFPETVYNPERKKVDLIKPKMIDFKYQNLSSLKDCISFKYPHLKDWINYLIYKRYTDFSPLLKVKIIYQVWNYETMFFGAPQTKLTDDEKEIAILIYQQNQLEETESKPLKKKNENRNSK